MRAAPDERTARRLAGGILRPAVALLVVLATASCSASADAPARPAPPAGPPAPPPTAAADPPARPAVAVQSAALPPVERAIAPVRLEVRSVGVDVTVRPVGVEEGGAMQLPANPQIAGWYRFGPDARADRGTMVLAAHVDSLQFGVGPFARVRDLPEGARIRVTDDAGDLQIWTVRATERVAKDALPTASVFARDGDRRLVLITCGGTFDTATRTYSDNVIVTAAPAAG